MGNTIDFKLTVNEVSKVRLAYYINKFRVEAGLSKAPSIVALKMAEEFQNWDKWHEEVTLQKVKEEPLNYCKVQDYINSQQGLFALIRNGTISIDDVIQVLDDDYCKVWVSDGKELVLYYGSIKGVDL